MTLENKGSKPFFRTRYLIYPRFQLMLIVVNLILIICTYLITVMVVSHALGRFIEIGKAIHLAPDHPYFRLIEFQLNSVYGSLITALMTALITASLITLIISHRLAGPIVRMRNYFKEIVAAEKISKQLKFRKGDFFEDLPAVVNDALKVVGKGGSDR